MTELDWLAVERIDEWLDTAVSPVYREEPLAQDWARVGKVIEEAGEAIDALIGTTGQNPRKGVYAEMDDLTGELADVAWTAILAIQHFTKDRAETRRVISTRLARIFARVPAEEPKPEPDDGGFL